MKNEFLKQNFAISIFSFLLIVLNHSLINSYLNIKELLSIYIFLYLLHYSLIVFILRVKNTNSDDLTNSLMLTVLIKFMGILVYCFILSKIYSDNSKVVIGNFLICYLLYLVYYMVTASKIVNK